MHDHTVGDIVYVEMTGMYHKLDCNKKGTYRITEVSTNGKFRFQKGKANKHINIRWLTPQLFVQSYRYP